MNPRVKEGVVVTLPLVASMMLISTLDEEDFVGHGKNE